MASTIDHIIATLRQLNVIAPEKINYGITDKLKPPYINVLDFSSHYEYASNGVAGSIRESEFKILVTHEDQSAGEAIAEQIDNAINCQNTLTPSTVGCLQTGYMVGQLVNEPQALYQFGIQSTYQLTESLALPA